MEQYKNSGGKSGITAYEAGPDYIKVTFTDGAVYTYTNKSAGKRCITRMKQLALQGVGLNAYINRNVKYKYESKL